VISPRDAFPYLFLLIALGGNWVLAAEAEGPRGYLGVAVEGVEELPDLPDEAGGPYETAARVGLLVPGAAGERSGLEPGDLILSLDGEPFEVEPGKVGKEFRARLKERKRGERVRFLVFRSGLLTRVRRDGHLLEDPLAVLGDFDEALAALPDGAILEVSAVRRSRLLDLTVELGEHPHDRPARRPALDEAETHGRLLGRASPVERFGRMAVDHYGLAEETADLMRRLADLHNSDEGFRLDDVRFVHRHPWRVGAAAEDLLAALAPRKSGQSLPARIREVALRDRFDLAGLDFEPLPRGVGAEVHAAALEGLLAETAALVAAAFEPLSPVEREVLEMHWAGVGRALHQQGIYLHADQDRLRRRHNMDVLAAAARVDRRALYAAALSWARLAEAGWLGALRRDLGDDPRAGEPYILRRETPHGEIVIGGRGPNRYRDMEPALVIDLGGDDVYSNNAGSSSGEGRPAAAVIDLAGDDAYESTADGAQAAGIFGVGLLVDLAGDDRYLGLDWAQGAGLLGIGILVDAAGDDTYRALHLAQGAALWGAGFLLDGGGEDRYEILLYGQGLGLPGGFGLLHDGGGADRYYAKGGFPTNYGTQGVFDAWAQGVGMGFRHLQSGGVGVLADDGGRDRYEAGNFSQGGGYYYGWGLLNDRGRDGDSYIGSRYNQGFSCHQAAGAFIEDGGDDLYVTRNAVIAGLAWDESVTWFLDRSGDDTYRAGGFSLGASAHNAFALFVDADGRDRYEGAAPARAGGNDYHDGTSLSLFLDLGRGEDRYDRGLRPGEVRVGGEHGIAADLPGRLERHLSETVFERYAPPAGEE